VPIVPVGTTIGGYLAHDKIARGDSIPDAGRVRLLAGRINTLLGRRFKRLWQKSGPGFSTYSAAGSATTWRGLFHTSPNIKGVRVEMILRGSDSVGSDRYYEWTVGGVAQRRRRVVTDTTATTAANFQLRFDSQEFVDGSGDPLAGDTQYEFSLTVNDGCRVIGATIYELKRDVLDTDLHVAVRTDPLAIGSPVLAREIEDLHNGAWSVWQKQGPVHVAWSNDDVTPPTRTGSTYANVIDASTAGYSASAAGQWHYTTDHGRYSADTVPCVFWCYASVNAGAGGRVRFTDSGGTMATITGIGTTPQIYTTTATIACRDSLVVVEHSDAGVNTITTHAAGFYELGT
jgi:hypothetical protein